MDKLLLVDGSNLLFQMFYGMPSRIVNKAGKPVHGTLGFVGALLKILKMTKPTYALVLFDGESFNPRCDVDAQYKANRPDYSQMPEEETPFSQMSDICAALDYLGIKRAETTVCETDDVIAAYALKFGKEMQVAISSFDSDFFQLINENVRVLRYRGENTVVCDETYLFEKFGITPRQYADFKSLTGDKADNVKGVPKVGIKTAAELLKRFGDLETLSLRLAEVEKPAVRNSLMQSKELLAKNRKLIRLDGCAELPFPLSELAFTQVAATTGEVLSAVGIF